MAALGGIVEQQNNQEFSNLAKFAVDEHNTRENKQLSFIQLVSSKKQVVSGILYHLIVEVESEGLKKLYEAKVLEKAWQNFKSLESFVPYHGGQ
ncbi:hypothetical protein KP509_06G052500 [Ceratopteris richardii]|uniref:Cysteine proteinase inhibitor n=1 Tax=Ceratopteris richardii TaxID=49495 RepID=A0A8T2UNP9_CERRI|nr:hypothetical protein KP509_06G052500 [Ceratopteris richardii]